MKKVNEIMSRSVHVLHTKDTLDHAEWMFKQHHVRHLPVMKAEKLVGMLSLTDLQRLSFADNFSELNEGEATVDVAVYNMIGLAQVMTRNVETVSPETSIKEVAKILANREYHALPVTQNDKLVGIITTTDLIKYLAEISTD